MKIELDTIDVNTVLDALYLRSLVTQNIITRIKSEHARQSQAESPKEQQQGEAQ